MDIYIYIDIDIDIYIYIYMYIYMCVCVLTSWCLCLCVFVHLTVPICNGMTSLNHDSKVLASIVWAMATEQSDPAIENPARSCLRLRFFVAAIGNSVGSRVPTVVGHWINEQVWILLVSILVLSCTQTNRYAMSSQSLSCDLKWQCQFKLSATRALAQ